MKTFCEITAWWNWYYIRNQISPHFNYYPVQLMLDKGLNVEVLTELIPERAEAEHESVENLQIRRFKRNNDLSFSARFFGHMIKRDYSLIHLHSINLYANHTIWLVSKLKNTPMIFTSHSPLLLESLLKVESGMPYIDKMILKNALMISDSPTCVFIAFTQCQAESYRKIGVRNIRVIPHCIDPKVFQVEKDNRIASKYGLDENNLICVGNLQPRKGQLFLIESMPRILKEFPNTKLLLSSRIYEESDKEYRKILELRASKLGIKDRVVFLGDVPREDLIQLYLLSSIFVFPTESEMFGLVFLEAMAAGLPIITTNKPYIAEILDHGKAGMLVEREQTEIENAVLRLLGDKELRKKMGAHGQKIVEQKYRLDDVVQQYWSLYKSFLE